MKTNIFRTTRPTLFTTNLKSVVSANRQDNVTIQNQETKSPYYSGSFRYDQIGEALKSTQEIQLDYTLFENHTFFNSAVAKVNVAFDKIINNYPFDGKQEEIQKFEDDLTGYERYILGIFPKYRGFLRFDGTFGNYIEVKDATGINFPETSKNSEGESVLNPRTNSFSFEMFLYPPPISNNNQIVVQKRKDINQGITIGLAQNASTTQCDINFIVSNSTQELSASATINKGEFNHLYFEYNASPASSGTLKIFKNLELAGQSGNQLIFTDLDFSNSSLFIGTGATHKNFIPASTLSGALDELRFYHNIVEYDKLSYNWKKEVFAQNDLKLYMKFNEPTGSYSSNDVVLDSSGNSLHSYIENFDVVLRNAVGIENPMTAEDIQRSVTLFSDYPDTIALNEILLDDARDFDAQNPNLITKLIPAHYLREGMKSQGFTDEDGTIGETFTGTGVPGTGVIGSPQIITAMLLVYAKFFDELKIFIDHFSNLVHVDYDTNESIADKLLPFLAKYYGFDLPSFFSAATGEQFYEGRNITQNDEKLAQNLNYVRNQIWRRLLVNISSIMREKGTNASVRSLLAASGIIPDNFFTIREFGGPKKNALTGRREIKTEISAMIDFSGSLAPVVENLDYQGFSTNKPHIVGSYLSGSRVEPGFPNIAGSFVNGVSNQPNDGLFTSGSFSIEGIFKYTDRQPHYVSESLMRLHTTGTATADRHLIIANLVAVTGSSNSDIGLKLFCQPTGSEPGINPAISLFLTGVDIFDGNKWNVLFGRQRADEISALSSSYFIKCGRSVDQDTIIFYQTSSYFSDASNAGNILEFELSSNNSSGSFVVIGSQSIDSSTLSRFGINRSSNQTAKTTDFSGKVAQLRMWSKYLDDQEFTEHVRNYKSLGVQNPLKNFSFDLETTGSFERLRYDVSTDQDDVITDANGNIQLFDFSQNNLLFTGTGFESSKLVIKPETFYYSHLAPNFDQSVTNNKVRVRSLQSPLEYDIQTARIAPVYDIIRTEEPEDDRRFAIEYSIVKALNEDIIRLLADLDFYNDALGKPSYLYDDFYPDIDQMRKIYFNRLTDKLNYRVFFDLFKWFDTSFSGLITDLMPKKTQFNGVNFTIESHMIERHKLRYIYDQQYLIGRVITQSPRGTVNTVSGITS